MRNFCTTSITLLPSIIQNNCINNSLVIRLLDYLFNHKMIYPYLMSALRNYLVRFQPNEL